MITFLFIVQFVLVFIICVAVLLQKSSSIGLGAYSGSNESLFGAKGPAGFLAKFTFVIGILLIVNTISLGYLYNTRAHSNSLVERLNSIIPSLEQNASGNLIETMPASQSNDQNLSQ